MNALGAVHLLASACHAAPKARIRDVLKEIRALDRPNAPAGQATPFPLKKASAARMESLISNV